uniref:Integrin beta n=1 Tax=Pyxicephalus adspersus TaxID=30357 RepID=A0AAV2ZXT8_PYXAD|nr:TPA: hypothetical protein GDO54_015366 [Pyxicephalus adspersus]
MENICSNDPGVPPYIGGGFIEGPKSGVNVTRKLPLSSKGSGSTQSDIIQVTPQSLSLSLRPGAAASFKMQVRQVEDYPVDLYYLMDLSLSMKDDLDNIRNLGTRLAAEMAKLTSNFRLGFGTFVDKNVSPFSYTAPKYQNNPCTGTPFLLHLWFLCLQNFTALIPGTTVEILDQSSQNILQLIVNAYNNIRSKVELIVSETPEDLELSFTATCQDGASYPGLRKCGELMIGDTVSFEVSVQARSCPPPGTSHTFTIKPVGFRDTLEVTVTYKCSCGCSHLEEASSRKCSGNGTFTCGVCNCDSGFLGARCECGEDDDSSSSSLTTCRESESHTVCNGRGRCICGLCSCYEREFGRISGSYCQCDDFSCARFKGILCSGHGECDCGECKCHAGYIGDNCNCTTETRSCMSSDGQMCSGKGNCVCGRCQCVEPGAFGETCEKCPTCPDACGTKRDCIECRLYQTGRLADNQTCQKLCKDEIILVDALEPDKPEAVQCVYKTDNECVMRFMYSEEASGKSILSVLKEPECASAPEALTVLLAVVGSILLVGLVLLAVWKLLVTIHDRREFARFQSERSRAKYEMASNPLYRQPISTHNMEEVYSMMGKSYNGTSNGYREDGDNY